MIRTFPCFAAATPKQSIANALTHACEVDAEGFPARVLCKRVKLESICADLTQATDEVPTCKGCLAKLPWWMRMLAKASRDRTHGDRFAGRPGLRRNRERDRGLLRPWREREKGLLLHGDSSGMGFVSLDPPSVTPPALRAEQSTLVVRGCRLGGIRSLDAD